MHLTDDTLQRLVDGELSTREYQDALLALEADPSTCESNAWRRCALSFLESQAFELGAKSWLEAKNRNEPEFDQEHSSLATHITPSRRIPAWVMLLTVAASLAGAFWVGGLMGDWSRPATPVTGFANNRDLLKEVQDARQTFEGDASDGSFLVSVPVEDATEFDSAAWVKETPTPLSPEIQRKWEQEGYTVRARRRLIPITIPNGRTIIAPFEQYEKVPLNSALQ